MSVPGNESRENHPASQQLSVRPMTEQRTVMMVVLLNYIINLTLSAYNPSKS